MVGRSFHGVLLLETRLETVPINFELLLPEYVPEGWLSPTPLQSLVNGFIKAISFLSWCYCDHVRALMEEFKVSGLKWLLFEYSGCPLVERPDTRLWD